MGIGEGEGVGVGVGVGIGVGVGVGVWACAEDDDAAADSTRMLAMTTALAIPRPRPFSLGGRNKQHIKSIPEERRQLDEKYKYFGRQGRFAVTSAGASIGPGPSNPRIAEHCCSAATGRVLALPWFFRFYRAKPEAC
jgi:hypothetical protein